MESTTPSNWPRRKPSFSCLLSILMIWMAIIWACANGAYFMCTLTRVYTLIDRQTFMHACACICTQTRRCKQACMCVCMYVCIPIFAYVLATTKVYTDLDDNVLGLYCLHLLFCVPVLYVCMHVYIHVYGRACVHMYVIMYACAFLRMHACTLTQIVLRLGTIWISTVFLGSLPSFIRGVQPAPTTALFRVRHPNKTVHMRHHRRLSCLQRTREPTWILHLQRVKRLSDCPWILRAVSRVRICHESLV